MTSQDEDFYSAVEKKVLKIMFKMLKLLIAF